jgi:hypothetical protein
MRHRNTAHATLAALIAALGIAMTTGLGGCNASTHRSFGDDVEFLRRYTDSTVVLGADVLGPRVAIVADYQGRVMTSSATGDAGTSYGWLNYDVIASGELVPHINVFGGEERFWLGPEGGQFSLYFEAGDEFTINDWQTPAVIDSEPFELVEADATVARYRRTASLTNYSGTTFDMRINRDVVLLDDAEITAALGITLGDASAVAYETRNRVTNIGERAWTKDTGLVSVWLLGMFNPGERTTVVIPFRTGSEDDLGRIVNDEYFGKVPAERLVVGEGVMFFRADSQYRSKIGLTPRRATPVAGSWDPDLGVLTIVQVPLPGPNVTDYVNSMWEIQDHPYAGDAINSYNDGPTTPGGEALGGFYEIETSSPALSLGRGDTGTHISRTIHIEGNRRDLDLIAQRVLGVGLAEIEGVFGS